ncbi:hypothetical protein ACIQUS_14370 [Pseudomonas sp. NPDC090755]|uniref:hypothetical protein n=1 Tax=Pseudomonas sp. NPDC090755 TaxID=3364481 RepID=UPI003839EE53
MNKNKWPRFCAAVILAALLLWYQQLPVPLSRATSAMLHAIPTSMPINNHTIAR